MGNPAVTGAYAVVEDALAAGRCVLLDGGVATELPHALGQDHEHQWGIEALASAPDEVLSVHRSYVDAQVDVLTANTWSLPSMLGSTRAERDRPGSVTWMDIARRGVSVARRAIAEAGRAGDVAVAFSLNGDIATEDGPETVALLHRALAEDPPDLILLETLTLLDPSMFEVIDAVLGTQIPLWLSFRRCRHGLCGVYGQHWGGPEGDTFGRAARRLEEMGVSALLVNCIPPDHVDGVVAGLRDFTDLALGVYPNLGYYTSAGWRTETQTGGDQYAEMALRWRSEGAQIIGGCCGTRPEHIAAAGAALVGTAPGRRRPDEPPRPGHASPNGRRAAQSWTDRRGHPLQPLAFPQITRLPGVSAPIPGSYLLWRHLFEHGIGAHQRCLDIGAGTGLQTVQLALNGAAHVHAIDVDERAVLNTLDNAFRNGVAEQVTAERADIFPWVPSERYELVVANLPQVPVDPVSQMRSHRPVDFWGRGLVDQVIAKLPSAVASEGTALLVICSLLSGEQTLELIDQNGLTASILAWELQELSGELRAHQDHLDNVEQRGDAFMLHLDDTDVMVNYLVQIRHASASPEVRHPPARPS